MRSGWGLKEIELWPEEDEGQGIFGDEGGPGPSYNAPAPSARLTVRE